MEWTLIFLILCSVSATVIPAEIPGGGVGSTLNFLQSSVYVIYFILGNRCYECNFSPSGYIKDSVGWKNEGESIGYHRCALQDEQDAEEVDKWKCTSGVCFLRRDSNGLVYRGCADENFLPNGVNVSMSCSQQGSSQSLWWFCTGELCNGGAVGENLHCDTADSISPMYTDDVNDVDYNFSALELEGYESNQGVEGKESSADEGEEDLSSEKIYREALADKYYERAQQRSEMIAELCDGKCEGNPSGLFADPQYADHFVQCSIGFRGGQQCHCCFAFSRPCPPGTKRFDPFMKVCL
ncbi:hypothetical protein CAPTEDRAFT_216761 [Capitella teleta]|uniref:Chitin-binding type-2 domain-containing protein n=1 Tax=Capitella teleta TaxID=283909 RepID=R7V0B0_CAPTE|nr:hypothetical protein CAPTEDRAFT_216761 [Capitella teleta]|eukprot:ELU11957.1 hypothetical protein CAPTEDRAFT_216761 [Capitella teleta]